MTQPPSQNPSAEVQQSFADLYALEEHAIGLVFKPPRIIKENLIIHFANYQPWILFFYCLADPLSFIMSKLIASDDWFHLKNTKTTSNKLKLIFIYLAFAFGFIFSYRMLDISETTFKYFFGTTPHGANSLPAWIYWPIALILSVWAGAHVINWCRFILNKKFFILRFFIFVLFLIAVRLSHLIDGTYVWLMRVSPPFISDQYWLIYAFFILLFLAMMSFVFWFIAKTIVLFLVLVYYLQLNNFELARTANSDNVLQLLKPVQLKNVRIFSLDALPSTQLRSTQEWTKNRIEAINYRFVSISAFLAFFTLFTTGDTGQKLVNKIFSPVINLYFRQESLTFGEILLGLSLPMVIVFPLVLFYYYLLSIVALNLIREACILIQYNNPPVPQPQPTPAVGGQPQPWYKVSLIFLLTSLVFLFTSIIKDRRSK